MHMHMHRYAICLSLLDGGRPVVGLLGCPNLSPTDARASAATGCAAGGTLAWAVRGGGAFACAALQEAQLPQLSQADARVRNRRPTRVSAAVAPARVGRCEAFEAGHSSRGKAAAAAALGLTAEPVRMDGQGKYAVLARGEAQLFTRLPRAGYRENIWDVAAGVHIYACACACTSHARACACACHAHDMSMQHAHAHAHARAHA